MLFRPESWDRAIWSNVAERNEYRLPELFEASDTIVDVGTHIGGFSYACLERGAGRVFGYEADRANYGLAVHNLSEFEDRARVYRAAVWRSDRSGDVLHFAPSSNGVNTGGGNVMFADTGATVPTIALDEILQRIGAVRLLKMDCEGSEFPSLLTCSELARVQEICGEFHECGGEYDENPIPAAAVVDGVETFSVNVLAACLERAGFVVEWERSVTPTGPCNLGHFFAQRA